MKCRLRSLPLSQGLAVNLKYHRWIFPPRRASIPPRILPQIYTPLPFHLVQLRLAPHSIH